MYTSINLHNFYVSPFFSGTSTYICVIAIFSGTSPCTGGYIVENAAIPIFGPL